VTGRSQGDKVRESAPGEYPNPAEPVPQRSQYRVVIPESDCSHAGFAAHSSRFCNAENPHRMQCRTFCLRGARCARDARGPAAGCAAPGVVASRATGVPARSCRLARRCSAWGRAWRAWRRGRALARAERLPIAGRRGKPAGRLTHAHPSAASGITAWARSRPRDKTPGSVRKRQRRAALYHYRQRAR